MQATKVMIFPFCGFYGFCGEFDVRKMENLYGKKIYGIQKRFNVNIF